MEQTITDDKYLTADYILEHPNLTTPLTIKEVALEPMRNTKKLVLGFDNTDKKLVLNQTNKKTISYFLGFMPRKWIEHIIELKIVDITTSDKRQTKAIRINKVT